MTRVQSLILLIVLLMSCSQEHDPRLERVADLLDKNPKQAIADLDNINQDSLSKGDRHYYDFLTIKARDKAYVTHTSDSLILDVINYYEGTDLYPEALYYGGRVYSDLGDYPTALDYFQRGIDEAGPTTPENMTIKGSLLSQTARLLNSLRLYNQAKPYLKEALHIDSLERDTFNLAYDHQLLGAIYMHQDSLTTADSYLQTALKWAQHLDDEDKADIKLLSAVVKYKQGHVSTASNLIKQLSQRVSTFEQNMAMAYVSDIYLNENNPDSAYLYANMLVHSSDDNNRRNGYYTLFSNDLYRKIPADSLHIYINKYRETLENYYNKHESQNAILQNTAYNYSIQQRERDKAENKVDRLIYLTGFLLLIILISVIIILLLRARKQSLRLSLQSAIINLDELNSIIETKNNRVTNSPLKVTTSLDELRQRLFNQIDNLKNKSIAKENINTNLTNSEIYKIIGQHISSDKNIPDESPLWSQLEQTILAQSPLFKERLQLLTGQNLKDLDYHIILLIRCGITPTQMAILLSRVKSTISYHRKLICETILGEQIDNMYIDDLIRCI